MRLLIVVDDADRDAVLDTKEDDGRFLFVGLGHKVCKASVVGEVDVVSYTGNGDHGKAMYDVTMLEVMTPLS